MKKLAHILNRPRLVHYADIFLAAFGVDLLANQQHLFGAHGLNAVKSVAIAGAIAGAKALLEAYRKSSPSSPYASLVDELAAALAKLSPSSEDPPAIPPASPELAESSLPQKESVT